MSSSPLPNDEETQDEAVFSEINITPLTDIFLVLLIIFMVTSSVIIAPQGNSAQNGIRVNLPQGGNTTTSLPSNDLPIAILSDGRLVASGHVVSPEELTAVFNEAKSKAPNTLVVIQADEGVPHGKVVEVMGMAQNAGLEQLAIGVRQTQK
ncbi:MAG: biopolymer transporter ExbD [Proteobacteria bacterium]|nr:biopolymer transporter ExbD [Cystobacterineae bacterium]MCL2259256.1 biopolymer transporter ExbD [Cystobacterineae bacterium]MCL2314366.1 biopolymer transporter ExbD [Pseudomonadota bacterium]